MFPLTVDDAGLERFARAVSTPGSSLFGRYEPLALLSRRFGASPASQARVVAALRRLGASRVEPDGTGMAVQASMRVDDVQRAFGTPLKVGRAADGSPFLAPAGAHAASARTPLPPSLRGLVTTVIGLDTRPVARGASGGHGSPPVARSAAGGGSGYEPASGTGAGCSQALATGGFTPQQYLSAYGYNTLRQRGLLGQGERVALIEIDGFAYSDLRSFASCFGLPIPRLSVFAVGPRRQLPPGPEATLDLEVLDAAAPGLTGVDVYESAVTNAAGISRALALPLVNPGAKPQVISVSLGLCEPFMRLVFGPQGIRALDRYAELAAATGITLVAASGDRGSADCQLANGGVLDQLAVNYPASSPWATGVGGTNLVLDRANRITAQPVWNEGAAQLAAGGGGASVIFGRPSFQRPAVPVNRRIVPDVAMLADLSPGYAVYCTARPFCAAGGPWITVGGTSAATPLVAAGAALVDQDLHRQGRENLGFMNPLLYGIGQTPQLSRHVFYDVTVGNNDIGPYIPGGNHRGLGCCRATLGFDPATGWGSLKLDGFDSAALARLPSYGDVSIAFPARQHPARSGRLALRLGCSQACSAYAFAVISLGPGQNILSLSRTVRLKARRNATVLLRFTRPDAAAIRGALRRHRRVVVEAFGVGLDRSGRVAAVTAGRTLRISS